MSKKENNFAFIDGQNLYLGVKEFDWEFNYARFRVHLKETYGVDRAMIFLGFVHGNEELYEMLETPALLTLSTYSSSG